MSRVKLFEFGRFMIELEKYKNSAYTEYKIIVRHITPQHKVKPPR